MKTKISLFVIITLYFSISGFAYDFTSEGIYYNILSGTTNVEVTFKTTTYVSVLTLKNTICY